MFFIIFLLFFLLCLDFSLKYSKEIKQNQLLEKRANKLLKIFLILYFFCGILLRKHPFYFIPFYLLPIFALQVVFTLLKKQKDKNLLNKLHSLLTPAMGHMKLGLGFMDAWQKSLEILKNKPEYLELLKISEILRFQKSYQHKQPEIQNFIFHLLEIRKHPQAIKKLRHLKSKMQIELNFIKKSKQALFQIRLQSLSMSLFYTGILIWNFACYGFQHIFLTLSSCFFFILGLIWIFKTGERLKWSL